MAHSLVGWFVTKQAIQNNERTGETWFVRRTSSAPEPDQRLKAWANLSKRAWRPVSERDLLAKHSYDQNFKFDLACWPEAVESQASIRSRLLRNHSPPGFQMHDNSESRCFGLLEEVFRPKNPLSDLGVTRMQDADEIEPEAYTSYSGSSPRIVPQGEAAKHKHEHEQAQEETWRRRRHDTSLMMMMMRRRSRRRRRMGARRI